MIFAKQFENSENYEKVIKIIKQKNINTKIVVATDIVKIEKDLRIEILWPNPSNIIGVNVLNNNSLVFKLKYKNFSVLFTGDIEQMAEKQILEEYKNSNILNSTVLKVSHHRFKHINHRRIYKKSKTSNSINRCGRK